MKLNLFVKSVLKEYKSDNIKAEDVLGLYKDNFLTEEECLQVLEGGKNGIHISNSFPNIRNS